MGNRERFIFVCSEEDKAKLAALAKRAGASRAAICRGLIRQAWRRRGSVVWPPWEAVAELGQLEDGVAEEA